MVVAAWSFFLFLHYISKTEYLALFTSRLLHSAAVFIPACYLHFIIRLLGIERKRPLQRAYALSIIFLIAAFTPYFVSGVEPKLNFNFYSTAGPLYSLWMLSYLGIAGYGIYLMLKNYSLSSSVKKTQIKYVLVASVIGFAGGLTIYPLFYNIFIAPVGEHIIFLYPVIFTIAVLKHNLLDLNIVIKRTIVYSISVILITLVYLIVVLLSERLLRNMVGYQSLSVTLIAAVVIALLFTPIKNRVQSIADRFYVNGAYHRFKKEFLESDRRKAMANLAAGMAHEIRNPLTAIKTFAEYLPEKYNDADFREKFSRIVTTEVDKIDSLISQLLEFAKPSVLKVSAVNIHDVLENTLNLLSGETIKFNIRVSKDYTKEKGIIYADANKLRHVFLNILKNAIESMQGGGELRVSTSCTEDRFRIEITDTGVGIKQKDLNRIFDPFYSLKEKGTGLGLAIAKSIVTEHGGSISVKSNPGSGTVFTLLL